MTPSPQSSTAAGQFHPFLSIPTTRSDAAGHTLSISAASFIALPFQKQTRSSLGVFTKTQSSAIDAAQFVTIAPRL